jgi:putative ABC transport system substrate-binding protein
MEIRQKSMLRKVASFSLLLITIALFNVTCDGSSSTNGYKIGVTQIRSHSALDEVREGFVLQMEIEGFTEGSNIKYLYHNAEGDMSKATSGAEWFIDKNVDLIFAISTPSAQVCVKETRNKTIPVIFAAVTDPVEAKIVNSWENPGGTSTGASDWADVKEQVKLGMDILRGDADIYPATRLGVIYNPSEVNSQVQIRELRKALPDLGIVEIVEAKVATADGVRDGAQSLVGRVDAIWLAADNTVASVVDVIVEICEQNRIPLFSSGVSMARAGAISGLGIDSRSHGKEAAKVAIRVLQGEDPALIPVSKTPLTIVYLSPMAAERMGVTIPQRLLDKATEIGN